MPDSRFIVIWEFQVRAEATARFEKIYGPEGDWAQLFRSSNDYQGTTLLRDTARPGRYLTIDHWTSRVALHHFKREYQAQYEVLDRRCENLTEHELLLGNFEEVWEYESDVLTPGT